VKGCLSVGYGIFLAPSCKGLEESAARTDLVAQSADLFVASLDSRLKAGFLFHQLLMHVPQLLEMHNHCHLVILLLLFFYPQYQGSRGVCEKIRRKCVGVTITQGSPQTQRNRVAARR